MKNGVKWHPCFEEGVLVLAEVLLPEVCEAESFFDPSLTDAHQPLLLALTLLPLWVLVSDRRGHGGLVHAGNGFGGGFGLGIDDVSDASSDHLTDAGGRDEAVQDQAESLKHEPDLACDDALRQAVDEELVLRLGWKQFEKRPLPHLHRAFFPGNVAVRQPCRANVGTLLIPVVVWRGSQPLFGLLLSPEVGEKLRGNTAFLGCRVLFFLFFLVVRT